MKITFLSPSLNMSGGTKVMAIYADYLLKQGHDVSVVFTPVAAKPSFRQWLRNALRLKFHYPIIQASHFDQLNVKTHLIDSYRPIGNDDVPDADIVIATWWETCEWLQHLDDTKGKKVYFIQGHEIFNDIPKSRAIATYKTDMTKIVVSKWLKDVIEEQYQSNNIKLVLNAIDTDNFYFNKRSKNETPTIGFLVGESHVKALDIALKVVVELKKIHPNLQVNCFGVHRPTNLPVDDQFKFHLLPTQHEIREIYASCDVWLAVSRSEGFNLTAMEAMACGTPVVSTNTGWPVAAIKPFKNGFLTDVDDVLSLVDGVNWFLNLPNSVWQSCSVSANETTRGSSWEKSASMFESVLIDCAAGKNDERHPTID